MASLHAANFSLRFKRKDVTVFLFCDGSSTFGTIKQRVRLGLCSGCSDTPPLCAP